MLEIRPSGVGGFARCNYAWYLSRVCQVPDRRTGAALVGTGFHAGVEHNFFQKIESRKDLEASECMEVAEAAFDKGAEDIDWDYEARNKEPDREKAKAQSLKLVEYYIDAHAPGIQPKEVELTMQCQLGGAIISGTMDLLTEDGVLIDHKTKKRKPSGPDASHNMQLAIYREMARQNGFDVKKAELHYVVKTKEPSFATFEVPECALVPAEAIVASIETRIDMVTTSDVLKQMPHLLFPPNIDTWQCSTKWCAYHPNNGGECSFGVGK